MTTISSISEEGGQEPKPKKHVRFADEVDRPTEDKNVMTDEMQQPVPQEVINKIKAVYFTKETQTLTYEIKKFNSQKVSLPTGGPPIYL